jgi:hypothetical protein
MHSIQLFIGSSGKARPIATELVDKLRDRQPTPKRKFEVEFISRWKDSFTAGESTLDGLLQQVSQCDFAAILLTKDDIALKDGDQEMLVPRDNCIYELGLFTGGLCSKRAFILSSVKRTALPSDLAGITYLRIEEEEGKKRNDSLEKCAKAILDAIDEQGPFERPIVPLISDKLLLRLEQPKSDEGNLEEESTVIVNVIEPLELDMVFAKRVQQNIKSAIDYLYVFHADPRNTRVIARVIQSLAYVGYADVPISDRLEEIENDNAQKALKTLRSLQGNLSIYFNPKKPEFQMCIHNADRHVSTRCYLRRAWGNEEKFAIWYQGDAARDVASPLFSFYNCLIVKQERCIFGSSSSFQLTAPENAVFTANLTESLKKLFPEKSHSQVLQICFGK